MTGPSWRSGTCRRGCVHQLAEFPSGGAARGGITVRGDDQSILTIGIFSDRGLLLAGASGIALVGCSSYVPVSQVQGRPARLPARHTGC